MVDYYRKIERSVTISADKRSTVDLQVDVWSADANITKFILKLDTADSTAIDLTDANVTTALVYDGVILQDNGQVEEVATQRISYVLNERLRGYEGVVNGGFYVTLKTGQKIDIQNVSFNMRKSLIDTDLEPAKESYYQTFDGIVADVQSTGETQKEAINAVLPTVSSHAEAQKQAINSTVSDVNGYADSQKQVINNIVSDVQSTGDAAKADINAALPALKTQVSQLSESITDFQNAVGIETIEGINKFDKSSIFENLTFNSDGDVVEDSSKKLFMSDYLDIGSCKAVWFGFYNVGKWNLSNTYITAYDINKNRIGTRYMTNGENGFVIPNGCKYVRLVHGKQYADFDMLVDLNYTPTKYIPYIAPHKTITKNKIYYVGQEKQYKSFSECVIEAVKYQNSTVYVEDGTYDIEAEFKELFGTDFFDVFTRDNMRGLYLNNNIKIILSPNSTIKMHYSGDNSDVKSEFAPFNFAPYSLFSKVCDVNGYSIEGGNIDVKNVRYCVHDDPSSFNKAYINEYRNVNMSLDNTQNSAWGSTQCIGGGLGTNGSVLVENCTFYSAGSRPDKCSLSYHNTSQPNAKSHIVIKDNYFYGNDTVRMLWHGPSTMASKCIVTNNNVGRPIEIRANSADQTNENMELLEWNNHIHNS